MVSLKMVPKPKKGPKLQLRVPEHVPEAPKKDFCYFI